MNPKSFAEHFHILSDAPNGIQKMREMILQLAVKGKLVPQDLNDEPVSVLLKKIKVEKEMLIKEGKIKKQKPLPPIYPDEVPHELPVSWAWVRLGNVTNYGIADKVEPGYINDGTWVLELKDIEKTTSRLLVRGRYPEKEFKSTKNVFIEGDVLYGKLRPYLDKVLVADEPGVCTTEMIPIQGYGGINPFFLRIALKAPDFIAYANASTHGMNLPRLGTEKARLFTCALPPIAEQKRIVTKVDQLMAFCDELKAGQRKRAQNRIKLNSSCLNALITADEDSTQNAWQRISDNFNLLYEFPENVSELRQAILQLAVQGKLVPQDLQEEPASVLLKEIGAEKEKLIKEGKIRKQKPLPPIDPDELPYKLPERWEWVRLGKISTKIHYGYTASAIPIVRDVRFLRITDIQDDHVKWSEVPGCQMDEAKFKDYELSGGDILIARTGGTIGKSYLVTDLSVRAVFASYLIRVILTSNTFSQYIKLFLGSELYWTQLYDKSMGTGQPNVNATALKSLCVPLPPLAEQKRIVAKVNQLMVLCHELEAKLKQSQSTAETLMRAVVNELTVA